MIRFLSKDLLSGLMFIAFGMAALYFGQKLALGTPVRMGPGYVPRMLSFILLCLGSIIVLVTLFRTADRAEKERYWIPVAGLTVAVFAFSMIPWGANFIATNILGPANQAAFKTMTIPFMVSALLVIDVIILMVLVSYLRPARRGGRRSGRGAEVEADHHGDDRHRALRAAVRARRPFAVRWS